MATIDDCRTALHGLSSRLATNAATARDKLSMDRTLACSITDLGVAFHGRLLDGQILDLRDGDNPTARIRLKTASDDLVALVAGTLSAGSAWSSGRIKLEASFLDLVKLRKLL